MTLQRHEIPTHLNVEDKVFAGLTVRQVMFLTAGAASGYGLWNQWPALPLGPRLGLALACALLAAVVALVRPHGRGLEAWAFVILHYLAVPRVCTWHLPEPDPAKWRPAATAWAELAPPLSWQPAPGADERPAWGQPPAEVRR